MTADLRATQLLENAHVRVTRLDFEPGAATGPHKHMHDYVIITGAGGDFVITMPDGSTVDMHQEAGAAYTRSRGTEHDVKCISEAGAYFIEIELLDA